ncbi:MAG: diguanylate cyclase [Erythrobacter sp.]|uniref:sensor domain-containing diguanylate cyclase n=1 Tax=Erythrobacter sp. TaxID=1042 RepID=UPI0026084DF1|nr:sensor domain-containing diguanylate cyclase [Erythrobacter sp.]MDJ0979394.1 diguanylate cyclase [Erythrobacter sp.]
MRISLAEGAALHGLLEEATGDIVVKVDPHGFIETASSNIIEIGYDLSQLLLKPHLADLAKREYAAELKAHLEAVLAGSPEENASVEWLEFPVGIAETPSHLEARPHQKVWYALSLRAMKNEDGAVIGALGLLRSVERLRALEGEVYSRARIDPLTGLANRHAICASLRRQLAAGEEGALALFEIDRMRAVYLQYGQRTADEIICGFAKFLEAVVPKDCELGQFDGERFCVILPGLARKASLDWAQEALETFASLTLTTTARSPRLSASAGLAVIETSVDWTLRQAELALVMARARGGMQVAQSQEPSLTRSRVAL